MLKGFLNLLSKTTPEKKQHLKTSAMDEIIFMMMDSPEMSSDAQIIERINLLPDKKCIDRDGRTLLINAASYERLAVLKFLIEKGANINAVDNYGYTALHMASDHNDVKIASALLESGAEVNIRDMNGNTPLIISSSFEMIKELMAYGADPDLRNNYNVSPRMVFEEHPNVIELFNTKD